MHGKTVYWGICSAGRISHDFTSVLRHLPADEHQVKAVAASSLDRAKSFANTHGIHRAYGSYEELASDPELDIIYVASINSLHYTHTRMMLNAGKAVLCEKPFALNVAQAKSLFSLAKAKNVFLMEGIWSRFFPAYTALRKAIDNGEIGDVRLVQSAFGLNVTDEGLLPRLVTKSLGGGALFDLGGYQIQLCQYVFQEAPTGQRTMGYLNDEGVDVSSNTTLKYANRRLGSMATSLICDFANEATICGTKGFVRIHAPFWAPTAISVNGERREFPLTKIPGIKYLNSEGLRYEAEEVRKCLMDNLLESQVVKHNMSLEIADILEKARKQVGYTLKQDEENWAC